MAAATHKNLRKLSYTDALIVGSAVVLGLFALVPAQQPIITESTEILLPTSDGAYSQLKPKIGTARFVMVDETTCNGTVDYNSSDIVGYRGSYGIDLASVPDGATITAIEITPCASLNETGGISTMNVFYIYNDVLSADAGNYELKGTTPTQHAATTWSGLSLLKGPLSTLEIGAVLSAGNRGARLGRIATVLTYISLSPPLNLVAKNVAISQNNLSWKDASSGEDGFKIERSTNSQFEPSFQIATTSAGIASYRNTGLVADETYYYRVRAFNSGGGSGYSNIAHAITETVVPQNPSNLTVAASSSSVILNWVQSSRNEEGFRIERWTSGANFTEIGTEGIDATSYIDKGLASGTYYYRVRAWNRIGDSAYSNTASVVIP